MFQEIFVTYLLLYTWAKSLERLLGCTCGKWTHSVLSNIVKPYLFGKEISEIIKDLAKIERGGLIVLCLTGSKRSNFLSS